MEAHNVLVVEDDLAVSQLVVEVLTDAGYHPVAVADHALIAETVALWRPSCVILDGELMPSGESRAWRDAAALRRAHPTLPVLLFSGDEAIVAEVRAGRSYRSRAAAFAGIIAKPFVIDDLLATVLTSVEGSSHADPLAIIVHELRQPLTVIRGQMQFATRYLGQDAVRVRSAIDQTLTQVRRMDDLVDEVLEHARVAAEGFSLDVTLLDLVDTLARTIAAHEPGEAGRISFIRPAGAVPVYGDAVRIAQIVDNLLSNARKYGPADGPIEVSLSTDGINAEVHVADHGIGVPDDEVALLFTPFFRTSRAGRTRGTGLGLHISRKLAEHHGGRLWLDATSSAGSVFALALPLARSEEAPMARPS
ncbi:MAG TPA: ATP-binding protein [Candidatus Acidoferrales bacterium]|nr:ATP-binding protein [Candidatus Acidoferrales bacterium]